MAVISPNHIPSASHNGPRGIQYRRAQAVALGAQRLHVGVVDHRKISFVALV